MHTEVEEGEEIGQNVSGAGSEHAMNADAIMIPLCN